MSTLLYDAETERTLTFAQYRHDVALRERRAAALIDLGISPGITNFFIGDHTNYLRGLGRKDFEIEAVHLYLLEDIDADAVIFSWAPAVTLDELSQHPLRLDQGHMEKLPPFTGAGEYRFPHEPKPWRQFRACARCLRCLTPGLGHGATGSGSTPDDAAGALTPWSPSF